MIESAKKYGDIVFFKVGNERIYLFNHPDLIRDVLVTNQKNFTKSRALVRAKRVLGEGLLTSEGEFHLRQRRLAQPAFHRDRISAYGRSMVEYADRTRSRWTDGRSLDVHDEMMRLTLAIVAKTLFSADVEKEAAEIGEALTTAFGAFNIGILPFSELLEKLPLPYIKRFEAARARLDATIYRIIDERRATGEDRGDLLSMLLLAQDTEGDGGGMTDTQVRDEAMTIFLAGHETTANALSWTWYLLSQHPEIEARFHREVDALGRSLPRPDDLANLPYTRMISPSRCVSIRRRGRWDGGQSTTSRRADITFRRARWCSCLNTSRTAIRAFTPSPRGSIRSDGCRKLRRRVPGFPTSLLAAGRAFASESSSPGWKEF